jgi:site-specific DNA-methyltransferase (adenine-specific)
MGKFILGDCMDLETGLPSYPDKFFDLAIVDPPYGAGDVAAFTPRAKGSNKNKIHKETEWNTVPTQEYFDELFRVSKSQIIWGGNYFPLPPTQCFYIWDKKQPHDFSLAMCEMAWTSFSKPAKIWNLSVLKEQNKIHPTQKPVEIYEWLIKNNAEPNQKILDTHLGSGSIALAVDKANQLDKMNLHLTACEIDKEYIDKAIKRISESIKQGTLSF